LLPGSGGNAGSEQDESGSLLTIGSAPELLLERSIAGSLITIFMEHEGVCATGSYLSWQAIEHLTTP
jgi:hypothetical protein